ncbi:MAG: HAMP domain-containing histidine kinase [Flavobacteriales bacterium]|nr:HAMP domain-containing histidine kinase [Flavobacteriales bacterium]
MSTKLRMALLFAGLSLLLLLGVLGYIFVSHSASRQEEFYERLEAQCVRTASLLDVVREADKRLLRVMDMNTIHRIHDEKVLVFDADDHLIYSSLDDEPIPYSAEVLKGIRDAGHKAWRDDDGDEVVGIRYTADGTDLVVLASAFDKHGQEELRNLRNTLLITLALGALFIFGASYLYIGFTFQPIGQLDRAIATIDVDRLDQRVPEPKGNDEIHRLAVNYNHMLDRLRGAFDLQRAFVNNASHELRTPLARMNAQVERALALPAGSDGLKATLHTLQNDIAAQASLVESLLLLQRLQAHLPLHRSGVRVDEALYAALDEVHALHPDLLANVDIGPGIGSEKDLIVSANEILLRTMFLNLLRNAHTYAPDKRVSIAIDRSGATLVLRFSNTGAEALPPQVFAPFFRGVHGEHIKGSGLGLSIVEQVAADAGGAVQYHFGEGQHHFTVELPLAAMTRDAAVEAR